MPQMKAVTVREQISAGLRRYSRSSRDTFALTTCRNLKTKPEGLTPVELPADPFGLPIVKPIVSVLMTSTNLVADGTFSLSVNSYWTLGTGWVYDAINDYAYHTAGTASILSQVLQAGALRPGWYRVTFTVSNMSAGTLSTQLGTSVSDGFVSANGTYVYDIRVLSGVSQPAGSTLTLSASSAFNGRVDDVSVVRLLAEDFPFPQLFRGMSKTFLADYDSIFEVNDSALPWTLTYIPTYDVDSPSTRADIVASGNQWHFVDLGKAWLAVNGVNAVFQHNLVEAQNLDAIPNLIQNSAFSPTQDPWTFQTPTQASWTWEVGKMTYLTGTIYDRKLAYPLTGLVVGRQYLIKITVADYVAGQISVYLGVTLASPPFTYLNGEHTYSVVYASGSNFSIDPSNDFVGAVTNAEVRDAFSGEVLVQSDKVYNTACYHKGRVLVGGFRTSDVQPFWGSLAPNMVAWSSIGGGDVFLNLMTMTSPQYVIDTLIARNECGYMPMHSQGAVLKLSAMGDNVLVYTEDAVYALMFHNLQGLDLAVYGLRKVLGVGIHNRGAAAGGESGQVMIDKSGKMWRIAPDLSTQLLDYQDYFAASVVAGKEFLISHDPQFDDYYIAIEDGSSYILTPQGMTEMDVRVMSLEWIDGGLVGTMENSALGNMLAETDVFDLDDDRVKTVRRVFLGITEAAEVTVTFFSRMGRGDAWSEISVTLPADRTIPIWTSGVEFKLKLEAVSGTDLRVDYFTIEYELGGKRSVRSLLA